MLTGDLEFNCWFTYISLRAHTDSIPGFVQSLESPGILLFRIPGLKSPGKRRRSWKTMESPGILKQRFWIFLFLFGVVAEQIGISNTF